MTTSMSNLAAVVFRRTYSRPHVGRHETWGETVERAVRGNVAGRNVPDDEVRQLLAAMKARKATSAGRGLWYSGTEAHGRFGGTAAVNCWAFTGDDWHHLVIAQDMLMLGGGTGMSVEHRFVDRLPKVRKGVEIYHQPTRDAEFIVPDSREGWCELTRRVLEAFFETGRGFTFSTVCLRPAGEAIKGFGGTASGPGPLVRMVEKLSTVLRSREGKQCRPIDVADLLCSIGEMVVAGNVRRSAILILGDPWDKLFLKAKRWDLGPVPTQRAMANFSVNCDDTEDLHPAFWQTYEAGEAFGVVNVANIQRYARMGELKKDTARCVNPCGEAVLENAEPCNLAELALPNLSSADEFEQVARLMFRYAKRVTMDHYHQPLSAEVIARNRRVGVGITGCLQSDLFDAAVLDRVYTAIQREDEAYSAELGIPRSIRTTVIKPSGTVSKVLDVAGEGIHPGFARYMLQRIRFASTDPLVGALRRAGHHVEPVVRFDGTHDSNTMVADFYVHCPPSLPTVDEGFDTWAQLEAVLKAQRHWADQSVSSTVYYKREELPRLKGWLADNLQHLKTISFLPWSDHGFVQAPKEAITKERYEAEAGEILPIGEVEGDETLVDGMECAGGSCPVR